jgi:hypothetical protein
MQERKRNKPEKTFKPRTQKIFSKLKKHWTVLLKYPAQLILGMK